MKSERFTKFALFTLILPVTAWSAQELVTGAYDAANDWVVFQWNSPDRGLRKSIFDSGNKIKPAIRSSVSLDNAGNYVYGYEISNLAGAKQLLQDIYIPHLATISDPTAPAPSSEWFM